MWLQYKFMLRHRLQLEAKAFGTCETHQPYLARSCANSKQPQRPGQNTRAWQFSGATVHA